IAWLCVGKVDQFQEVPDLERFGWRRVGPVRRIHWERFLSG
ncbi:5,6-dimethylbenzimidazole synthase, partial [Rhodococcus hoagii]|nr:5,6-dimethylbenzimidazole synthase [Prescottella equi]